MLKQKLQIYYESKKRKTSPDIQIRRKSQGSPVRRPKQPIILQDYNYRTSQVWKVMDDQLHQFC